MLEGVMTLVHFLDGRRTAGGATGRGSGIAALRECEKHLKIQSEILSVFARNHEAGSAAAKVLGSVCRGMGWDWGEFWAAGSSGRLACVSVWHGKAGTREMERATRGLELGPGQGLPGRVWKTGRSEWVADITGAKLYVRAPAALRAGLHSAFAFPVASGDKREGVMAFFSRGAREPDAAATRIFGTVGQQLGLFMERTRTEAALADSEELLNLVLDNADDLIVIVDRNGVITRLNDAFNRHWGYDKDDFLGKNIADVGIFTQKSVMAMMAAFARRVKGLDTAPYVVEGRDSRGRPMFAEVHGSPIRRGGKIIGDVAILRETTERMRSESALKESEANLEAVIDSAGDGIVQLDTTGKILSINSAITKEYGWTDKDLVGSRVGALRMFPLKDLARLVAAYFRIVRSGNGEKDDYEAYTKDRRQVFVEIYSTGLRREGRVAGVVTLIRNITERKRAEKVVLDYEKKLEAEVKARTREISEHMEDLREKNRQLEDFKELAVKRELELVRLREEVARLSKLKA